VVRRALRANPEEKNRSGYGSIGRKISPKYQPKEQRNTAKR